MLSAEIRGGIYRAALRLFRLHPGWSDERMARAIEVGRDDMDLVAAARDELVGLGELPQTMVTSGRARA